MTGLDRRVPPGLAPGVAVGAVSTSAVFVRWSRASSGVAALYRVAFTVGLPLPVAVRPHREDFHRVGRRDLPFAGGAGLALAVHFAAWFESLAWTSVAASVALVQARPVFVAAGAWALLDERVTRRMAGGALLPLGGAAVMSLPGGGVAPRPLYGNALPLLGAVAAAGYLPAGRALRQRGGHSTGPIGSVSSSSTSCP